MSAHWALTVGDFYLLGSTNFIDPHWLTVFREEDHLTVLKTGRTVRRVSLPAYAASASSVADRLEFLGYTLLEVQRDFDRAVKNKLQETLDAGSPRVNFTYDEVTASNILPVLTFDRWRKAIRRVVRGRTSKYDLVNPMSPLQAVVNFILDDYEDDFLHGFPLADPFSILRVVVDMVSADTPVRLDYKELVGWGTYTKSDPLVEKAISALAADYAQASPVVLLTEGTFDRFVLDESLRLLRPALHGFFSFLNFSEDRVPGGVGNLVNNVKMLAATGIRSRVLGILDNDTASVSALRGLRNAKLPRHIGLTTLPELALAKRYPTVGPQGRRRVNVNGRACSIELFLGRDCLTVEGGRLTPIHWLALDRPTGRFQGELSQKDMVQKRFRSKVKLAHKDPSTLRSAMWNDLRGLWEHIIRNALKLRVA